MNSVAHRCKTPAPKDNKKAQTDLPNYLQPVLSGPLDDIERWSAGSGFSPLSRFMLGLQVLPTLGLAASQNLPSVKVILPYVLATVATTIEKHVSVRDLFVGAVLSAWGYDG